MTAGGKTRLRIIPIYLRGLEAKDEQARSPVVVRVMRQSQTEPDRARQGQTEPDRPRQSQTEPTRDGQHSQAGPDRAR